MGYYTTFAEAKEKYGILENQFLLILDTGELKPYNEHGDHIDSFKYTLLINEEFKKFLHSEKSPFSWDDLHDPTERISYVAQANVLKCLRFVSKELDNAIKRHYPDMHEYYHAKSEQQKAENVKPQTQSQTQSQVVNINIGGVSDKNIASILGERLVQTNFLPNQDEIKCKNPEIHIAEWANILPELNGHELMAAKIAIQKWLGKTHEEVFKAVRPGEKVEDPKNYVSTMKKPAEEIAEKYGLTMPDWTAK